jgi:hypothetical protein
MAVLLSPSYNLQFYIYSIKYNKRTKSVLYFGVLQHKPKCRDSREKRNKRERQIHTQTIPIFQIQFYNTTNIYINNTLSTSNRAITSQISTLSKFSQDFFLRLLSASRFDTRDEHTTTTTTTTGWPEFVVTSP